MPTLPCQLLALDLDGTMLDSTGRLSRENIAAVDKARAAGIRVVICTGRGFKECRRYLDQLGQTDPVVVAGGSIIADAKTGRTMHRFALGAALVGNAVQRLLSHRLPALVLKDPSEVGYDYLVVHGAEKFALDPVTEWWFEEMGLHARFVEHLAEDEHPEHAVRFGACAMSGILQTVQDDLEGVFGAETAMHHFPCVVAPHHVSRCHDRQDGQVLHVLEVFAKDGNKGSALGWVAKQMNVKLSHAAAVGDQINDLSMFAAVGLGIAMGNATERVKAATRYCTDCNDDHGAARAIERILAGEWCVNATMTHIM